MATKEPPFLSLCGKCRVETRHSVLCESVSRGDEHYNFKEAYSVIQCLGCHRKSFRHIFEDYEHAYPISNDEWDFDKTIECYPRVDATREELDTGEVPDLVREIYTE